MQIITYTVVGILFIFCGEYYSFEIAGRCIKYKNKEQMYIYIGGFRFCLKEGKFTYCREWMCHPKCSTVNDWPGVCEECSGTCADLGKLFKVREKYTCADNGNICTCSENNSIASTRKAQHVKEMCFDKLRNGKSS